MQAAKKLPAFDEDTLNIDIQALEDSAFSMGKSLKNYLRKTNVVIYVIIKGTDVVMSSELLF